MLPSTLPPNSARIGYAVEGVLITAHLSTDITPKSLVLLVPSKMFAKLQYYYSDCGSRKQGIILPTEITLVD